jgi:two-component system response regulator CpxR
MIPTYLSPKKVVLCVENDEAILSYEKALLERSGYAVLTAGSAPQALRLVTMCRCDAVLLDYDMLAMNECEVASEIKLVRPELIVVLLSGSEVPIHVSALVDAVVPKLEASGLLLSRLAEFCSASQDVRHKQESIRYEDQRRMLPGARQVPGCG